MNFKGQYMKRLHIHIGVENLDDSIRFYSALFGVKPAKIKDDYANWQLEDPRLNFAISTRVAERGVDHLGLQVDEEAELEGLRWRLRNAGMQLSDEGETVCCYARSDKSWVQDPSGIAWEAYRTTEDTEYFSNREQEESACCTPGTASQASDCCVAS